MINMRVRQNRIGDNFGIERQRPIFNVAFFPLSLKHPAIQKNPILLRTDQVHRTGYFPRCSVKCNVHKIQFAPLRFCNVNASS